MKTQDEALTISNPRLLAAAYFGLLSIITTIALDTVFYLLGVEQLIPIAKAIFLAVIIASCFGALFGKRIVISEKPYNKHVFWWAFLMVMAALPVYNLGLMYFLSEHHAELFASVTPLHLLYLYLFVLGYSFILAGVWFAIIAGLAAMYLRGFVVYYILRSIYKRPQSNINNDKEHLANDRE